MLAVRAASLACLLTVTACASDGRDLAEPQSWQTTTTRPPPPTSAPPSEPSDSGLELSSPDFAPGADAPQDTSCRGSNVFPTLQWSAPPSNTVELAVAMSDQTDPAEPLLLWLAAGIPPGTTELPAGTIPAGAFETLNDFGSLGYGSPCLNSFSTGTRDIQFRLYVLPAASGLESGAPGNTAWETVAGAAVESASLMMRIDSDDP